MMALSSDMSHRVPIIKHVLTAGVDYARLPEPFCAHAVLCLHDAVELFLQLASEHLGADVSQKSDFLQYWPALTKKLGKAFPEQQTMKRLNQARVGLKHSGVRPSRDDVQGLAEKTVAFLEEASRIVFGAAFSELSTTGLVGYEPIMSRLRHAENLAASGAFAKSAEMCALAFDEIMRLFLKKNGDEWHYSPFPHLNDVTRYRRIYSGYEWQKENRELSSHLEKLSAAFADIEHFLLILTLGIEYPALREIQEGHATG